jgi:predicted nucleic acid-binding protein
VYVPHLAGRVGVLSFITLAELYRWPEERDWGPRRRAELDLLLERYAVAYPDEGLCRRWAVLIAAVRRAGRPLPFADSWIAATALHLDLPLVTHNPADFHGIPGLLVISAAPAST